MFHTHSAEKLVEWTRQLRYFRYMREPRGADRLEAKWCYRDVNEIQQFATHLGFEINVFDEKPDQAIVGVSYSSDVTFASLIPDTKWWEQPGNVNIDGEKIYIYCARGIVNMSIFYGGGEVYAEQFESAIRFEAKLLSLQLDFIVPPVNQKYCFSETTYPEYFDLKGKLSLFTSKFRKNR